MALNRKNSKTKKQSNTAPDQTIPEMPTSFTDVDQKLPRKPIGSIVLNGLLSCSRFIFSPEFTVIAGYGIAITSLAASALGYYAVIDLMLGLLKVANPKVFGIISIIPAIVGGGGACIIQYKELAPRIYKIFPDLADRAAFRAGRDRKVNPKETADTPSMLPTYKWYARNGDTLKHRELKRDSFICYVLEGVGALLAIGKFLGSANPLIQFGAILWGAVAVAGAEFGVSHAESAREHILTPEEARDYMVEKSNSQANAAANQ